jgi:hypothetical protein
MLLVGSVVLAGIITYQVRYGRRPPSAPSAQPPIALPETSAQAGQPTPGLPLPPSATSPPGAVPAARIIVPSEGWGRNPFLTPDEIAKLNLPPPEVVAAPPEPPPAPPPLPQYEVTAIIIGDKGTLAIVSPNSRVVRVGDRLGLETVTAIKEQAVVLEHDGKIREITLKPATLDAPPAAPSAPAPPATTPATAPKGEQP